MKPTEQSPVTSYQEVNNVTASEEPQALSEPQAYRITRTGMSLLHPLRWAPHLERIPQNPPMKSRSYLLSYLQDTLQLKIMSSYDIRSVDPNQHVTGIHLQFHH